MAFQAQWAGECTECGERFDADDWIERAPGGYRHALCPALVAGRTKPSPLGVCPKCFTERSLTGECAC